MLDQILEPERLSLQHLDREPRHRTLRMRRGQLPARCARMLGQFQRAGAGGGIDIVEMQEALAGALMLHQFQRDVVILIPLQPRTQRGAQHGEGHAHLDARIMAFQIGLVVVEHRLDHFEAEGASRMGIEAAHDARHVDALLARLQAYRAGHRCLQRQIAVVAGVKADRQAEIRDADMLKQLLLAADQAGRAVLQVGQPGAIGRIGAEVRRVAPRERPLRGKQAGHTLAEFGSRLGPRRLGPELQAGKCCLGLRARGQRLGFARLGGADVHGSHL